MRPESVWLLIYKYQKIGLWLLKWWFKPAGCGFRDERQTRAVLRLLTSVLAILTAVVQRDGI